MDIASGATNPVRFDNRDDLEPTEGSNIAEFSPDGRYILFDRYEANLDDHWAVIPTGGGSAVNIGIEWPDHRDGIGPEAHWSPDGKSVTAFYPGMTPEEDQLLSLDPTAPGSYQRVSLPATYLPAYQRVAP